MNSNKDSFFEKIKDNIHVVDTLSSDGESDDGEGDVLDKVFKIEVKEGDVLADTGYDSDDADDDAADAIELQKLLFQPVDDHSNGNGSSKRSKHINEISSSSGSSKGSFSDGDDEVNNFDCLNSPNSVIMFKAEYNTNTSKKAKGSRKGRKNTASANSTPNSKATKQINSKTNRPISPNNTPTTTTTKTDRRKDTRESHKKKTPSTSSSPTNTPNSANSRSDRSKETQLRKRALERSRSRSRSPVRKQDSARAPTTPTTTTSSTTTKNLVTVAINAISGVAANIRSRAGSSSRPRAAKRAKR